ncbi:hypothetical protein, partial [Burkholderia humptydooensis]|uniref:hypothetical protein n=1 Tax=Burkholderia humptydooensis TaxID=430531 RepID=UPI0012FD2F88
SGRIVGRRIGNERRAGRGERVRRHGATAVATVTGPAFPTVRPPRFAAARSPGYVFDAAPRALLLLFHCSFLRPLPCTTKS